MEKAFWQERWRNGEIGFHQAEVNPHLIRYGSELNLDAGEQVFVPLCGKSLDMLWLLQQGYSVSGIELDRTACDGFFRENNLSVSVSECSRFQHFRHQNLELLCGDVFDLTPDDLTDVRAVYDRAALVAFPPEMRRRYAELLLHCLPRGVKVLLVTLQRPSAGGPPFTVTDQEVSNLFGERFELQCLAEADAWDRPEWREAVWLLTDR
ncbi:thiopurine S-methyltransferase [Neptuniibacter sp. CAU 1671]|uniref:thiopurine S-methyltransferase n=1 Tax=Neptuniibacter sp. CAU 1671 TaxID=3032593 RepID=UPI0023DA91DC|nr:thiopurine S-methyltransferase [Neptuniibacter sp. CAU 1671]MDF2182343.1 thiopurine S-methyltransferase [Neptuniibacter sp. CAU 1671]